MSEETNISIPRIMEAKVYRGLSPQDQEEYVEKKMAEIVEMNPNGITIPDVEDKTPFTRPTIIKHLDKLVALRKAYKIKRGKKIFVYHPNGRPVHPEYQIEKKGTEKEPHFRATFLNNNYGEFLFLEDLNPQSVAGGSMLIRRPDIQNFFGFMKEIAERDKKLRIIP